MEPLLTRFETGEIPGSEFGHRQHVEVVWSYLQILPPEKVLQRIVEGIQALARFNHVPDLYQEELTRRWVERIAEAWEANPGEDFASFVELHPELLLKDGYRR